MMYMYIVQRTQIYLTEEETRALDGEARSSGRTKSQLIRTAIDRMYLGGRTGRALLDALRRSRGSWQRSQSGGEYVERLRAGRLARLHRR